MYRFLFLLSCLLLFTFSPLQAAGPAVEGTVRVGIFPLEPLNFIDDNGDAQGFNPDLLRQIARLQGWSVRFVPGSWGEGLERLQSGEIDLMMMVVHTAERAEVMDFTTESLIEVWGQLFALPSSNLTSIAKLAGQRVAIMRKDVNGRNFIATAEKLGVSCEYQEYANFSEVFSAVREGAAVAGVAPQHFGLRHAGDYGLIPSSIQFSPVTAYLATQKGKNYNLLSQLDIQLNRWKLDQDSYYYQQLAYWLGVKQTRTEILPVWLLWGIGVVVAIALLLLFMSMLLKTQIKKRTAELAQSNEELRSSQQRYEGLISSMVQPMALHEIICDAAGKPIDYRFLAVNPAYQELLNKPASEILGKRVLELLPELETHWIDTFGQVALTGEPAHFQDYTSVLDRHFDVAAYSPEKGQFAAIITDISTRIKVEAERRRLEEQVLQTQKLESLGVLAGGIAHDFNNILMAVLGHCELALRRISKESPAKSNLEQIKSSASKAADLANQMLAYSGKGKFVVDAHDLSGIVAEMEPMLSVSVSKKVVMRFEFAPHLPHLYARCG